MIIAFKWLERVTTIVKGQEIEQRMERHYGIMIGKNFEISYSVRMK